MTANKKTFGKALKDVQEAELAIVEYTMSDEACEAYRRGRSSFGDKLMLLKVKLHSARQSPAYVEANK